MSRIALTGMRILAFGSGAIGAEQGPPRVVLPRGIASAGGSLRSSDPKSSLARSALWGALSGLGLAMLIAISVSLHAGPPSRINADAFAAYLDDLGSGTPAAPASLSYALKR